MATLEVVVAQGGVPRQRHDLLGDVAARVVEDLVAAGLELLVAGGRADDDAVAPGLGHRLDHQLVEAAEHVGTLVLVPQQVGGDVGDDRLLAQVVADEVGDVGVDRLVVGHPVANGVGDGDVAGAGGGHEPRDPEGGVGAERHGVEEVVVDAAVDDVDPLQALGGAHGHDVVVDDEIAALDQLDAHLRRQEDVLEVGRVEHAGREHHHGRAIARRRRSHPVQRVEQRAAVVVDGTDLLIGEHRGEHPGHRDPVLDDVADAAGVAEVVLEHAVGAVPVTDEVDPGHQAPGAERHGDAERLTAEAVGGFDHPGRDDPLVQRGPLPHVEVVEEGVEGLHPLHQAGLDVVPLVGRQDAGEEVHREGALDALALVVDGEGDALAAERRIAQAGPLEQVVGGEPGEPGQQRRVVGTDATVVVEDLVEEPVELVGREQAFGPDGPGLGAFGG